MKIKRFRLSFLLITVVGLFVWITPLKACENHGGMVLQSFDLCRVRLTDGPFKHAMDLNAQWMLSLEPDRFLCGFRELAGLEPKAPKYGGWEDSGVTGSAFGHYLSACAMMYAATGDDIYRERLEYILDEFELCQKAIGTGFFAGFPRAIEVFEEVASGDIRAAGFDLNGGWVPMYTMHKLFAGLVDIYLYTANEKCLTILTGLGEWFLGVFEPLTDEQLQEVLVSEHGGINEAIANVYGITGDVRYLRMAERLNHREIFEPLLARSDRLAGYHANTQIPKIVGAAAQYELGSGKENFEIADFFWNNVIDDHSYVIGGNSETEHFTMPGVLYHRLTEPTCETCNTYNMLKLTKILYRFEPSAAKTDYYERALYNHILASQHPETGMVCYMSPMGSGFRKNFSTPYDSFWCCVGTGFENHTRYGEFIYMTDAKQSLYINLFIPSVLDWKEKAARVEQMTDFPLSDTIRIKVNIGQDASFCVNLRRPGWADGKEQVMVNGRPVIFNTVMDNNYLSVDNQWADGDVITYIVPRSIHSEPIDGDDSLRAFLYGPIVLASVLDEGETIPVIITGGDVDVRHVPDEFKFTIANSHPAEIELVPYFKTADNRTALYFEHFTPSDWEGFGKRMVGNRDKTMEERRYSAISPANAQNITGENWAVKEHDGKEYLEAWNAGWFSFEMDVVPDIPVSLVCNYWGGVLYDNWFDIFIDDEFFAFECIHNWGPLYFDRTYKVPFDLTKGKEKIKVTFRPHREGKIAGPLFKCSVII